MSLIDVAILTALGEEKLVPVIEVLKQRATFVGETRHFGPNGYLFRVPCRAVDAAPEGEYMVLVISNDQMAGENMAAFATDVFQKAAPFASILTGIAAAVDVEGLQLANVAVASQIFGISSIAAIADELVFRKAGYHGQLRSAPSRRGTSWSTSTVIVPGRTPAGRASGRWCSA